MKKLLSLLTLLVVAISTFGQQKINVGGLEYSVLSEQDKTVQLTRGVGAKGNVVVPTDIIVPASQVLDIQWTTQSGPDWTNSEDENGHTVYKSGTIGDNESTVLRCTFRAKGTIAFMCRYQGENSCDYLTIGDCDTPCTRSSYSISLNGTSGTWTQIVIFPSDENEHYVEFCYSKDGSAFTAPDCAEVYLTVYEGGEYSVASISEGCTFQGNTNITSITIPASFTEFTAIRSKMFLCCTSLTSANLPAVTSIGSYAFAGCESLTEAIMPKLETIGDHAFGSYNEYVNGQWVYHYCTSLTTVDLSSVKSIGSSAFYSCSNISSLRIGSVEQWCGVNFDNSNNANPMSATSKFVDLYIGNSETPATNIEVPSTVTEIPNFAFYRTSITSVSASTATSIGGSAFSGCTSLTSANLPAATSIGSYAFRDCTSLASANLPAATSIGSSAFYNCTSLTSANLPAATSIGSYAFYNCGKLKSLSILKVERIGSSAFYNTYIDSLRIGSVEQYCSIEYEGTDRYQFPFQDDFDNSIFIGDSDTPVTEITIPETTQKIADYAFRGTGIHTVHFEGATPPALTSTNSFPTWTMLAVPDEAYETYMAADVYKTIPLQITKEGGITKDIALEANSGTSALLAKIGEDEVRYVVNLKVTGTINSYDMLIIRNQMPSLRSLDLTDASIVDCDYIYSNAGGVNYQSQKDVVTGEWLSGLMYIKLPSTTKSIGKKAFYNNTRLVSVTIPYGVDSIDDYAFSGCNRIKELTLPLSVTSFGFNAFYGCTGLREVAIPEGTTSLRSNAFYGCTNLERVSIPSSLTSINSNAFEVDNPLELRVSSLESWLGIQMTYSAFRNVAKLYVGDSAEPLEDLVIPSGTADLRDYAFAGFTGLKSVAFPSELASIGSYAFKGCSGIKEIHLPENVNAIKAYAFQNCSNLENLEFTDSIKSIGSYAFSGCSKLAKVELPSYLQSIGSYAFENCTNLSEMLIPASIKEIKDYAFRNCPNLNRVIATTVEPVRINQNTFSTYKTATLFTPKTSYYKYYWNTQYNQFLGKKEYDKEFAKTFEYKYFYLNGTNGDEKEDLTIDEETGTIHGVGDKNPDADFNEGAGVIVGGEQIQNLGDIHIHHNGNNGASVIAKNQGKVHIDNLYVDIKTQKNRWYFFCFPFDIKPREANFVGSHVWYLYDGAARALNGNGGWKKVASDGVMQSGNGYIFQGAINGTLTIHVKDITIDTNDNSTNMITYQSNNKNDASWNLIGNSNFAYYDINNLGYEAPITVYNNETGNYEAVRAGEDDCELYPFQAFFVQKPEGTDSLDFDNSMKETKNMADASQARKAAARAKAPKKVDALRKVINLELASADLVADSVAVPTDRTRIVVNPTKSTAYETDCDAAKFLADNMPQIYSLGLDGCTYAINERPVANGIVSIAVKTVKSGMYTITAPRLDREAKLRDLETGAEVDLSKGGYTFAAEAQTYTDRFQLILADEATAITAAEDEMAGISVEAGAIRVSKANADVKIYTVGGSLVASQKGEGSIHMSAGIYVVVVNGKSTKVTVKE